MKIDSNMQQNTFSIALLFIYLFLIHTQIVMCLQMILDPKIKFIYIVRMLLFLKNRKMEPNTKTIVGKYFSYFNSLKF